jgi:hypothetical protein
MRDWGTGTEKRPIVIRRGGGTDSVSLKGAWPFVVDLIWISLLACARHGLQGIPR